jgi:hypothetical protein
MSLSSIPWLNVERHGEQPAPDVHLDFCADCPNLNSMSMGMDGFCLRNDKKIPRHRALRRYRVEIVTTARQSGGGGSMWSLMRLKVC